MKISEKHKNLLKKILKIILISAGSLTALTAVGFGIYELQKTPRPSDEDICQSPQVKSLFEEKVNDFFRKEYRTRHDFKVSSRDWWLISKRSYDDGEPMCSAELTFTFTNGKRMHKTFDIQVYNSSNDKSDWKYDRLTTNHISYNERLLQGL